MTTPRTSFRTFYFLALGKFISEIGTYLDTVVFSLYVYQLSSSAIATGSFLALRLFGSVFAGFYAGVLADRLNRKRLMVVADCARALALLVLLLTPTTSHLNILYVIGFTLGIFNVLFDVSLRAAIPTILGNKQRVRANAIINSSIALAVVIGCLFSGLLADTLGYRITFLIDMATYLFSAIIIGSLKLHTNEKKASSSSSIRSFVNDVRLSYTALKALPILFAMIILRLLDAFGSGSQNIATPIFSQALYPEKPALAMGIIMATWGIGKFSASPLLRRYLERSDSRIEPTYAIAIFTMSASFVALFFSHTLPFILFFAATAGAADGASEICLDSRLQEIPDKTRGKVFGASYTFQMLGWGVGLYLCAPFFQWFSIGYVLLLFHILPIAACCAFAALLVVGHKKQAKVAQNK
ncbi:MFS transporter [Simkania negevensis]|uniref:MFS transporter n=1 Tax=Simkania negevensis TaxID=83561 RepID=A0ABS3AQI8_9BACT|nr:MFS transporter [Simkania negevensis]